MPRPGASKMTSTLRTIVTCATSVGWQKHHDLPRPGGPRSVHTRVAADVAAQTAERRRRGSAQNGPGNGCQP